MSATSTVPRVSLTLSEAAEAVGYSVDVIRAAVDRGELTPRYGSKTKPVIPVTELARWVESLPTERWA